MKKYLLLFFFISIVNSFAGPPKTNLDTGRMISDFNNWLFENGHMQYLEANEFYEECKNCSTWDAGPRCFEENGKPKKQCVLDGDQNYGEGGYKWGENSKYNNNLDIKIYSDRGDEIPSDVRPNDDTLLFYTYYKLKSYEDSKKKIIKPSKQPYKFNFNLMEDEDVKNEITRKKSTLLSYLLFKDDKIIIDEITPKDKFGIVFKDNTQWVSHSVGKSLVSYITGHAICEGYIESVDSKLNDWPDIKNTLYEEQKLIDILNMSSGDQNYVTERDGLKKTGRWFNSHSIKSFAENELKDTRSKNKKYNYHGLNTNIIFNYVIFKSGDKFDDLLDKLFREKAKIKDEAWFVYTRNSNDARYTFFLTKYDYLRVAKAIMHDWKNDTCVGKYLKTLNERKINKNKKEYKKTQIDNYTKSYGGQFHLNMVGGKDRNILGMDGYGGQQIVIDLDNSKIIVINSVHYGYDWNKIVKKKLD